MDHIRVEIGYEVIEEVVRRMGSFSEVKVERKEDKLNLIVSSKVMGFINIPVSIKFRPVNLQSSPDDPLVFEVETSSIVRKVLEEHSGKVYEYKNGRISFLPKSFSKIMEKMVVIGVEPADESLVLVMKPYFQ